MENEGEKLEHDGLHFACEAGLRVEVKREGQRVVAPHWPTFAVPEVRTPLSISEGRLALNGL